MRYSESTLKAWTSPLSDSEKQRAENAIKMIRSAIDNSDELKSMSIEVFTQGSFANNTNVRTESDVDVCVMLKDTFHAIYPDGKTDEDYGYISSDLTFLQYREMVKRALQHKFGADKVADGNKSLKIDENTYHVKADVVPAFQLRNYAHLNSLDSKRYTEGIWFYAKDGSSVQNYQKIHKNNGTKKNNITDYKYKKLVRIMKHIKNEMVDDRCANGDKITSFLVECLVWNIPNEKIMRYPSWSSTVREAIRYLYAEIEANRHTEWGEVSEVLYLFRNRKWSDHDAKNWLVDAWNYLGFSND